jgi:hypothetical protein
MKRARRLLRALALFPPRLGSRQRVTACLATALALGFTARAQGVVAQRFTGSFRGTGRACYGRLDVRTRTLSWLTSFSQCQSVPYQVLEQHEHGDERSFAFHLEQPTKGCRFQVVYLHHRDAPERDTGWEGIGYASLEDYRADEAQGFKAGPASSLACELIAH